MNVSRKEKVYGKVEKAGIQKMGKERDEKTF